MKSNRILMLLCASLAFVQTANAQTQAHRGHRDVDADPRPDRAGLRLSQPDAIEIGQEQLIDNLHTDVEVDERYLPPIQDAMGNLPPLQLNRTWQ